MIETNTPEIAAHFDRLCAAVQERGKGITLSQLGDAHALARELEKSEPDPERIEWLRGRLGFNEEPPNREDNDGEAS